MAGPIQEPGPSCADWEKELATPSNPTLAPDLVTYCATLTRGPFALGDPGNGEEVVIQPVIIS